MIASGAPVLTVRNSGTPQSKVSTVPTRYTGRRPTLSVSAPHKTVANMPSPAASMRAVKVVVRTANFSVLR